MAICSVDHVLQRIMHAIANGNKLLSAMGAYALRKQKQMHYFKANCSREALACFQLVKHFTPGNVFNIKKTARTERTCKLNACTPAMCLAIILRAKKK